jgi:Tfp pilus assembly protein PilF
MTKQEIQSWLDEIQESLEQRQLKRVFEILAVLFSSLHNRQLQEHLFELEDHYKMMLTYLIKGIQDPQQEKIYHDLIRSLYKLSDQISLLIKQQNSWSCYYDYKKSLSFNVPESPLQLKELLDNLLGKLNLAELLEEGVNNDNNLSLLRKEKEKIERKIFHKIWLGDTWGSGEKNIWTEMILSNLYPDELVCLMISSISLNLEESFDEKKALALMEICECETEKKRQRGITGLLLFLRRYHKRLYLYASIQNRLACLTENIRFNLDVRNVILQFILSRETEKITQKIKEEIIPEMMKIGPDLQNKIKLDDLLNDSGFDEKNPEWKNMLEGSNLSDKLQEFSELHMEGADVMHSSFIHLKNYSFFNEIAHWFLPFVFRSETNHDPDLNELKTTLMDSTLLCNSDKYSLFFSISSMPESYRKMMTSQFSAESSAMLEMTKEELSIGAQSIHPTTRQYIQDLYRFYKLYPRKRDFEDIFEFNSDFCEIPIIYNLISDPENLMIIAEYYFSRNYFKEACNIFQNLLEQDLNNEMLFQKIGYCLQMQGNLNMALEHYQKAELLNAANPWIVRKIAFCYRNLKRNEDAIVYYKKAEKLNPNNLSIQLSIGHCYLELKQYEEALKSYFKVEYLTDNKEKTWRPIAWCLFLVGKYDQAINYYKKILNSSKVNSTDFLNAGHTYLVMGNFKETIALYALCIKESGNSLEKFKLTLSNDIPDLINAGVSEDHIPFILDMLMYEV